MSPLKLFVVLAAHLQSGPRTAQAVHAARAFAATYPTLEQFWFEESNNIVVLQHPDLPSLAEKLEGKGLRLAKFHEPDLGGELTAFCAEPAAWRALSSLPLAR